MVSEPIAIAKAEEISFICHSLGSLCLYPKWPYILGTKYTHLSIQEISIYQYLILLYFIDH